jgi:CheY-like chemotaxis protein
MRYCSTLDCRAAGALLAGIFNEMDIKSSPNGVGPLSGLTVLLVDDRVESRVRVIEMLRGAGALVVGIRTPDAAFHYATASRFDAVIVDLPTEEGSRLLHVLRASPEPFANTPIFALSRARHDHGYRQLFTGYFLKPVKRDALTNALAPLPRRPASSYSR